MRYHDKPPVSKRETSLEPVDPAAFEDQQTRKFLGFGVRAFPKPQGVSGFDELPTDAPPFAFSLAPRKVSGPGPSASYEPRKRVRAEGPGGSLFEAYCGYGDDEVIAPGHSFRSTRINRRHLYGGGAYHPQDVYVGKRVKGKLHPTLFFRDVGSHNTAPHHLAVDRKGRCHLTVADVDIGQDNRFKLLWLVGDPSLGKWGEAWLIDHRARFTSWAYPWSGAAGETIHLVWTWQGGASPRRDADSGVFHVCRSTDRFARKVRVYKGEVDGLDMAIDPVGGRVLVVFSTEKGVFVTSRPAKGPWTRPTRLHPAFTREHDVSVKFLEKDRFVIRTKREETKEWLLQAK
jgi:hypothetical protein